jgi:hypothetical protein
MVNNSGISVHLTASGRNPRLSEFTHVCATLRNCLNHVARVVADRKIDFDLTELSYASAHLIVEPIGLDVPLDVLNDIESTFLNSVAAIQFNTELDARLDYAALRAFSDFCTPLRNPGVTLAIGQTLLTSQFVANVTTMLEPASPAYGSVSGMLEELSVHNGFRFTLFPPVEGEEIGCSFHESSLAEVLHAVGRKVTVIGNLKYAKSKAFPISVEVESFTLEQEDSALPNLLDARGMLRDQTPSIGDSEAWRNEW